MKFIKKMKYEKEFKKWSNINNSMLEMIIKYQTENDYEMASLYLKTKVMAFDNMIKYAERLDQL